MDDRTRKLGLAGMGVALFAGFVALTEWTGDDPGSVDSLDGQEQDDLMQFCAVFSSGFVPYDLVLRAAAGQSVSSEESAQLGVFDSAGTRSLAQSQIDMLADRVPDEYAADARQAAEGLERALQGDLDAEEVDEYVESFSRLEERAAEDCDAIEDVDFDSEGPSFGDGDDPRFVEDDPFVEDGPSPVPTTVPPP